MAGVLDNLSPTQKKLLAFGVPAVALVAVGLKLGRGNSSSDAAPTTGATAQRPILLPASSGASTDVIGVGQLADFESVVTAALGGLTDTLDQVLNTPSPTPATPCSASIYPQWKTGAVDCTCPPGLQVLDHRAGNRWTCITPGDLEDFNRLVSYVQTHGGSAPF